MSTDDSTLTLSRITEGGAQRVRAAELQALATAILMKVGVPAHDAHTVSEHLVSSDLRGMHSHGIMRLPIYAKRLQDGGIAPVAKIKTLTEGPATAVLDGGNGLGSVVAHHAMDLAIRKARDTGIAAVVARHSNHNGEGAAYALQATQADMIGLATTNASPIMPAWGGKTFFTGPLPLTVGVPTGRHRPIVFDAALGMSSRGKILYYAEKGLKLPPGWLVNQDGEPTTDPTDITRGGWILPIGGHKGWGLILMCEILTGFLSGGAVGKELAKLYGDSHRPQKNSHFLMAIDIARFISIAPFKARIDDYIDELKGSDLAPGVQKIVMPGEIEAECADRQSQEGIELEAKVIDEVVSVATHLGINVEH